MRLKLLIIIALAVVELPVMAAIPVDSPVEAREKAKNAKADLIVMAYGGEWDRLGKVFRSKVWVPSIKNMDAATFVSIAEFPQNPDKETNEKLEKRQKALNIDVGCLPSVYLFDSTGFRYAVLSGDTLPKTASSFSNAVSSLQAKRKKRDELISQAQSCTGIQKAKLLGMAADIQGIDRNNELVKQVMQADPKDETGYGKRLNFSIWSFHECFNKTKEEALEILDKELKSPFLTAEQKQSIYGLRGTVLRRNKGTAKELKDNYEKMYNLNPQSVLGKAAVKAMKAYVK